MRRKDPLGFVALTSLLSFATAFLLTTAAAEAIDPFEQVNTGQPGRIITPVNQVLTPAGIQVELPKLRPQAIALSPDGQVLATSGKTHELLLVNPTTGEIIENIPMPSDKSTNATTETVSPQ